MRGEIFNEFLEFAAESIGSEAAAALTTRDGRRAATAFDVARRYDLAELTYLADQLATICGEPRGAVLTSFGVHLFRYFAALYPTFLDEAVSAIALLRSINTYVHGELRKVYPDAEFPGFECTPVEPGGIEMTYRSARPLADLAEGLIRGSIEHFGDPVRILREDLPGIPGTAARFVVIPER
jgi:Haem-NO-binding